VTDLIELKLIKSFPHEIIAVDEVGRGPLIGPVVIGAIRFFVQDKKELSQLLKCLKPKGVTDSKKLTSKKRLEILADLGMGLLNYREKTHIFINSTKVDYVTWEMDHEVIDRENILAASLRGMKEASQFLSGKKKNQVTVLIDGNKKFRWGNKTSPFHEIPIIKGDQLSLLIGLASILAKEKRDSDMRQMHGLFPHYGLNAHFGYPTKFHKAAIKEFGPCPFHRKTFKGVKEVIAERTVLRA
jgi:ribonuclease HII